MVQKSALLKSDTAPLSMQGRPEPPSSTLIAQTLGVSEAMTQWLAGDGSDRCYYRVKVPGGGSFVLMLVVGKDKDALETGSYDWVVLAQTLQQNGIKVPQIRATLPHHGALLIEDYGDTMLETFVKDALYKGQTDNVLNLYRHVTDVVVKLLKIPSDPKERFCERSFDGERFAWELRFLMAQYVDPLSGVTRSPLEKDLFEKEHLSLAQYLASDSHFFVHRDLHSRNIMITDQGPALIDFQDGRLGPSTYDFVSLFFDSYIPLEIPHRLQLMEEAILKVKEALGPEQSEKMRTSWKPMLLQRQLKAIGSFGYLTREKKRGEYLQYVQPALKILLSCGLEDERWPYLSRTLLQELHERSVSFST